MSPKGDYKIIDKAPEGTFDAVLVDVETDDWSAKWTFVLLTAGAWKSTHVTKLTGPMSIKSADMCRVLGVPQQFRKSEVMGRKFRVTIKRDGSVGRVALIDMEEM